MTTHRFPIGQKLSLSGHFPEPVMLEGVRSIGDGFEKKSRRQFILSPGLT